MLLAWSGLEWFIQCDSTLVTKKIFLGPYSKNVTLVFWELIGQNLELEPLTVSAEGIST